MKVTRHCGRGVRVAALVTAIGLGTWAFMTVSVAKADQEVVPNGHVTESVNAWAVGIDKGYVPPSQGGWEFAKVNAQYQVDDTDTTTEAEYLYADWLWIPSWTLILVNRVDTSSRVYCAAWEDVVLGENEPETQFLYASGELEKDSEGDGQGGSPGESEPVTWSGEVTGISVKVTKVPEYMYADIDAAIPVTFEVVGCGTKVKLHDVMVGFIADSVMIMPGTDLRPRTAKGDGTGAVVNNDVPDTLSATYTTWVSHELLESFDVTEDTTDVCGFIVSVVVSDSDHPDMDPVWVTSEPGCDQVDWSSGGGEEYCNPRVFGDKNVKVVEIGYNPDAYTNPLNGSPGSAKKWAVTDATTKQTRIHREGASMWDHMAGYDDCQNFPGSSHECDADYPHHESECGYTCGGSDCGPLASSNWETIWEEPDRGANYRRVRSGMYQSTFTDCEYYHECRIKVGGETSGAYFGVSYGHLTSAIPAVTGAEPCMDISCTSGDGTFYLLPQAKVLMVTEQDGGCALGVPATGFRISGALLNLAGAGWAGAPLSIAGLIMGYVANVDTASVDGATQTRGTGVWLLARPGAALSEQPTPVSHTNENADDLTGNMSMNSTGIHVGDTWVGHVTLSAASEDSTCSFWSWTKVYGESKFYLPSGEFGDSNSMAVHSVR